MQTLVKNIVQKHLQKLYKNNINKGNYRIFRGIKYTLLPVNILEDDLCLSAYQQRNLLNEFQSQGILQVKFGQSRERYISFTQENEDAMLKAKIRKALSSLDTVKLKQIVDIIER